MRKLVLLLGIASDCSAQIAINGATAQSITGLASTVTYTTGATPTLTCPTGSTVVQFIPSAVLSANVTSVTFSGCTTGELMTVKFTQAASGGPYTVAGLPTGSPQISAYPSISTVYLFYWDGSAAKFAGVVPDGGPGQCTEQTAPTGNPPSGSIWTWCDSTDHMFEAKDSSGNINKLGASSGGGGGTNTQTSSYTLVSGDLGKLVVMNCSSACTVTLYGSPTSGYYGSVESIGSTVATVSLNSKNFNGSSSAPVLIKDQVVNFWSDGTNYFGNAPMVAGSNVTFTPASNGLTIASSGSGSGPFLYTAGPTSAITVTSADTVLADAGAVGAIPSGQCIGFQADITSSSGANGHTYKLWYGATVGTTGDHADVYTSSYAGPFHIHGEVCNNNGSATAQTIALWVVGQGGTTNQNYLDGIATGSQTASTGTLHIGITAQTNSLTTTDTVISFSAWKLF